eukprot:jgi/Chlat1/8798/Chrsp90S00888
MKAAAAAARSGPGADKEGQGHEGGGKHRAVTGYVWHELLGSGGYGWPATRCMQPLPGAESSETKRRLHSLLHVAGMLDNGIVESVRPRPATDEEILRFHTDDYIQRLRMMSDSVGGNAGEATPFGPGGFDIAALAAGGCIAAVDAVLDGFVQNCYALVRPPGHHAERYRGRGFCLLNNIVIAALHARQARGVQKIAIVDWDVHHGNGTQQAFYDNEQTLFISLHQDRHYPMESGGVEETGSGAGEGYTINVPLPAGSGHAAYIHAFREIIVPALEAFEPQLLLVSCGFDAGINVSPLNWHTSSTR